MPLGSARSRRHAGQVQSKTVMIWDWGQGKTLDAETREKSRPSVYNLANMPKDKRPQAAIPSAGFARYCSMPATNRTSNASRSAKRRSTDAESSDSVSVSPAA